MTGGRETGADDENADSKDETSREWRSGGKASEQRGRRGERQASRPSYRIGEAKRGILASFAHLSQMYDVA